MQPTDTWVELCAGAAACTLRLIGGPRLHPPVGWMGGKRLHASAILGVYGLEPRQGARNVVLADAGSWGWVWPILLDPGTAEAVCARLRELGRDRDPVELWHEIANQPIGGDQVEAAARWLIVQGGSAKGREVSLQGSQFSHHGSGRTQESAVEHGPHYSPGAIADSVEGVPRTRYTVHHGDVRDFEPIPGADVYFDPPYAGKTGYEHGLPRGAVLEVAQRWADAGCRVAVSEAEPLELPGWRHVDLRPVSRKGAGPEWLTCSFEPVRTPAVQLALV